MPELSSPDRSRRKAASEAIERRTGVWRFGIHAGPQCGQGRGNHTLPQAQLGFSTGLVAIRQCNRPGHSRGDVFGGRVGPWRSPSIPQEPRPRCSVSRRWLITIWPPRSVLMRRSWNGISASRSRGTCLCRFRLDWRELWTSPSTNIGSMLRPREGKVGGGYCAGMGNFGSRIMLNFVPSFGIVQTLAHELGHAHHNDCLMERTSLQTETPMTLGRDGVSMFCQRLVEDAVLAEVTGRSQTRCTRPDPLGSSRADSRSPRALQLRAGGL